MLNEAEIIKKLYVQAAIFKHHMRRKEYLQAAITADNAEMVAMVLEVPENVKIELFGTCQTDEPVIGLIREDEFLKASNWCTFNGYPHTRHTYENVMKSA